MGTVTKTEKIYYLSCLGEAATIIGRKMISPNLSPEPFTEELYNQNKSRIEFYEDQGVISVARPGTREAIVKADEIRKEENRLSEVYAGERDEDEEPDQTLRERGFSVTEKYAESQRGKRRPPASTFSVPGDDVEPETALKCVAILDSGRRCKNDAKEDLVVCGIHQRSLKNGRDLFDENDSKISRDGTTVIPE